MDIQTIRFINLNLVYLLGTPCLLTFLLFGAFGALCGMILFNHKTHKPLFYITVPILAILQIAAIVLFKLYI